MPSWYKDISHISSWPRNQITHTKQAHSLQFALSSLPQKRSVILSIQRTKATPILAFSFSPSCLLFLRSFGKKNRILQTKASPMKISFLTHYRGSLEVIQASTWNTYGSGGTRCSLSTWSQVSWSRAEHFRGCQSVPSILTRSLGCSEAI